MPLPELSRGARRLLDRLLWYGRRYGHIHPSQEKLGTKLGRSGRNVSDRTVRTYLRELEKYVEVQQGGDGVEASYYFTAALLADLSSGLTSGLLPGCFRAEIQWLKQEPALHQQVAGENLRAETPQLSSSSSLSSYQSEITLQERREPAIAEIEPSPYEKAQTEAIEREVLAAGFSPTPELMATLHRKASPYCVNGFVVAAVIARALKRVERKPSSRPRSPGWIVGVVENELAQNQRPTGTEQRDATGEKPATYRPKWTPAPRTPAIQNQPWPSTEPVAVVHQVDIAAVATTRATDPDCGETQIEQPAIPPSQDITSQGTPGQGMSSRGSEPARAEPTSALESLQPAETLQRPLQRAAAELSVEDRRLLGQARRIFPFASRENLLEAVAEMRTVQESDASAQPRPPQRELRTLAEVLPAAALGGLR